MNEDSKFDLWLEAHPKLDKCYTAAYVFTVLRVRSWKHKVHTAWLTRKYQPGGYFLNHGYTPSVITEKDGGAIYGISMMDGSGVVSDYWACGPDVVTKKEAYAVLAVLKKMGVK